jgi:hypothetical protein
MGPYRVETPQASGSTSSAGGELDRVHRLVPADIAFPERRIPMATPAGTANEAAVERLICFGYPFKHPDRPEELRRTAHRVDLHQPCLVFQGDRDGYDSRLDTARYRLSPSIRVASIDASHDYDALSTGDFHRCLSLIAEALDLVPPDPSQLDDRAWVI